MINDEIVENAIRLLSTDNHKTYYKNGVLEGDEYYIDGKKNGVFLYYHENGTLLEEIKYVEDKEVGVTKYYHENGMISKEVDNENNACRIWEENGDLRYSTMNYHF